MDFGYYTVDIQNHKSRLKQSLNQILFQILNFLMYVLMNSKEKSDSKKILRVEARSKTV